MARYGSGGYKQWEENRVTEYDKKTEGAGLGLTGWAGNQTVEHHAKILAEQRGKPGADYGKGSIYWDMAETDLIRKGRKGGDVHGEFRDYQMSEEIADLRGQLEGFNKGEADSKPKEPESPYDADYKMSDGLSGAKDRIRNMTGTTDPTNGFANDEKASSSLEELANAERNEAVAKSDGFGDGESLFTDNSAGQNYLNGYSTNLKAEIKRHKEKDGLVSLG